MSRVTGKVKWFNNSKGYGFIEHPAHGDIFCHYSAIQGDGFKTLEEGDEVEFEVTSGPKGPQAEKIIRLSADSPKEEMLSEDESVDERFIAIANIDGKNRLVSLTPDGRYQFLDEANNLHKLIYVVSSETLALQTAAEELESLMNDRNVSEQDFQEFFERHPDFILNDEYRSAHPHLTLSSEEGNLVPDFVLEPIDQNLLCDLLELKLPSAQIFVLEKNRLRYSQAVSRACAQLSEYSRFFDEKKNRDAIQSVHPWFRAFRPRMFVIIGRQPKDKTLDPIARRRIETDHFPNLTLRTYDEVLARVKWRIDSMKKGKLGF